MATVNFSTSRQYLNDEASFREALNKLTAANSLSVNAQGNLVPAGFFKDLFNGSVSTNRRLVEFKIMEFLIQGKKWLKPDDIKLVEQLASKVGLFMKKMDSGNRHKELRSLINLIVKEILQYKSVAPKDYTKLCQDFQARYRRILSPYSEQCEQVKRTFADVFKFQTDKGKGLERLVGDKIPFVGILNNKGADPAAPARDPAAPARPAGNAMNSSAEKMMWVAKGALATILSAAGVSTAYYTYQNWDSINIRIKPDLPVESSSMGYLGLAALGISAFALFAFKAKGGDFGQMVSNIKAIPLKTIADNVITTGMTKISQYKDSYDQLRNGNSSKAHSKDNEKVDKDDQGNSSLNTSDNKDKGDDLDQKEKNLNDGLKQNGGSELKDSQNEEPQNQNLLTRLWSGNKKEKEKEKIIENSENTNQIITKIEDTKTIVKSKEKKDVDQSLEDIKKAVTGICESNLSLEKNPELVILIVKDIDRLAKFCFAQINIKNDQSLIEKLKNIVEELSKEFFRLKGTMSTTEAFSSIDSECVKRSKMYLHFSSYADKDKVSYLMDILRFRLSTINYVLTGDHGAKVRLETVEKEIKTLLTSRIAAKSTTNIFKYFPLEELYILQQIYVHKDEDRITESTLHQKLSDTALYNEIPKEFYQKFDIYAKEFRCWSTLFNFKEGPEIKKNLDSAILSKENPVLEEDNQVENKQSNSQLEFSNSNSTSQGPRVTSPSSSYSYSTSGSNQQSYSLGNSFSKSLLEEKVEEKQDENEAFVRFSNRPRQDYKNIG